MKSNATPRIRSKDGKRLISTRQLGKHTSIVMGELAEGGGPLIITRDGVPFARLALLADEPAAQTDDEFRASTTPDGITLRPLVDS